MNGDLITKVKDGPFLDKGKNSTKDAKAAPQAAAAAF